MRSPQPFYTIAESNKHAFIKAFQFELALFEVRHDKLVDSYYLVSKTGRIPTIDSLAEIVKAAKAYVASRYLAVIDFERSMYFHPEHKYQPLCSL